MGGSLRNLFEIQRENFVFFLSSFLGSWDLVLMKRLNLEQRLKFSYHNPEATLLLDVHVIPFYGDLN